MTPHTKGWRAGDPVSCQVGATQLTGRVVVLTRQRDGLPYVKVEIPLANGSTRWAWPDGWVLGVGRHDHRCRACDRLYRTDDRQEVLCLACIRELDQADGFHDPTSRIRHPAPYMRGWKEREGHPKPTAGTPDPADKVENPFD